MARVRGFGGTWLWMAWITVASLSLTLGGPSAGRADEADELIVAEVDRLIRQGWQDNGVTPSPRADDGEFARRVSLDVVGHIPSLDTLSEFLNDPAPDKRARFVERLLDDPDYINHWSTTWANLLVGRGNRNVNRANLERWLRQSFYRNEPYSKFVYELISAEGDGSENGAVNFLSAHLNDGAVPATSITARLFLGMQVQCTQCHNHPFNDWKQSQFWGMNAFFRGTRRDRGAMRGAVSLVDEPVAGLVFFERRNGLQEAVERRFVDGTSAPTSLDAKPRTQLADLVIDPSRPFMPRTQVNRLWGHFLGFGFTRPVDDMGPHNAPSHPEVLDFLAREFAQGGYDNKRLIRWITSTEAYQLTSRFNEGNLEDDPLAGNMPLFSRMYVKSFTAEQLFDSLLIATQADQTVRNSDAVQQQRRTWLQQFIQTFGTDENDEATTFNGTIPQALVMMNGDLIGRATSAQPGSFLAKLLAAPSPKPAKTSRSVSSATRKPAAKGGPRVNRQLMDKIEALFLATLGRMPNDEELVAVNKVFQEAGVQDPIAGLQDLFWALLNSNEFILNH